MATVKYNQDFIPHAHKSWQWLLQLLLICDYLELSHKLNICLRFSSWNLQFCKYRYVKEAYLHYKWCSCVISISCQQEKLPCSHTFSFWYSSKKNNITIKDRYWQKNNFNSIVFKLLLFYDLVRLVYLLFIEMLSFTIYVSAVTYLLCQRSKSDSSCVSICRIS